MALATTMTRTIAPCTSGGAAAGVVAAGRALERRITSAPERFGAVSGQFVAVTCITELTDRATDRILMQRGACSI